MTRAIFGDFESQLASHPATKWHFNFNQDCSAIDVGSLGLSADGIVAPSVFALGHMVNGHNCCPAHRQGSKQLLAEVGRISVRGQIKP